MKIHVLDAAEADLASGFRFYELQKENLGWQFLESLFTDIDRLSTQAGIHEVVHGPFRCLARRFSFAIYYSLERDSVWVRAVLDCRQNPTSIESRLG